MTDVGDEGAVEIDGGGTGEEGEGAAVEGRRREEGRRVLGGHRLVQETRLCVHHSDGHLVLAPVRRDRRRPYYRELRRQGMIPNGSRHVRHLHFFVIETDYRLSHRGHCGHHGALYIVDYWCGAHLLSHYSSSISRSIDRLRRWRRRPVEGRLKGAQLGDLPSESWLRGAQHELCFLPVLACRLSNNSRVRHLKPFSPLARPHLEGLFLGVLHTNIVAGTPEGAEDLVDHFQLHVSPGLALEENSELTER